MHADLDRLCNESAPTAQRDSSNGGKADGREERGLHT